MEGRTFPVERRYAREAAELCQFRAQRGKIHVDRETAERMHGVRTPAIWLSGSGQARK